MNHRVGQLPLRDRTLFGKEAYDCKVAADVLTSLEYLDSTKLGGIGHSAGGETLIFWIYLDPRVRVGISSCGYFDLLRFFVSMPANDGWRRLLCRGSRLVGTSADYLVAICPRPLLLTRGNWEWGREGIEETWSRAHVAETSQMATVAAERYRGEGKGKNFRVIFFDEDGGNHDFPPTVRREAYTWLASYL